MCRHFQGNRNTDGYHCCLHPCSSLPRDTKVVRVAFGRLLHRSLLASVTLSIDQAQLLSSEIQASGVDGLEVSAVISRHTSVLPDLCGVGKLKWLTEPSEHFNWRGTSTRCITARVKLMNLTYPCRFLSRNRDSRYVMTHVAYRQRACNHACSKPWGTVPASSMLTLFVGKPSALR